MALMPSEQVLHRQVEWMVGFGLSALHDHCERRSTSLAYMVNSLNCVMVDLIYYYTQVDN